MGRRTRSSVGGGYFHGVRRDVGSIRASVFARTGEGDAFLVTGELYELAELLLSEHLQRAPEKLDVLISFHQAHLVHGVCLRKKKARRPLLLFSPLVSLPRLRFKRTEGEDNYTSLPRFSRLFKIIRKSSHGRALI